MSSELMIFAGGGLVALVLALLLRPLWRRPPLPPTTNARQEALAQQIALVDDLAAAGALQADAHAKTRSALEARLVAAVVEPGASAAAAGLGGGRDRGRLLLAAAGLAVLGAAGAWVWVGKPSNPGAGKASMSSPAAARGTAGAASSAAGHDVGPAQIAGMIEQLAQRLQKQPGDADGWMMLARSYAVGGQHEKAVPAFRKAVALRPADAVLLADFADALAMTQGRSLAGEPRKIVDQALKADPSNLKALSLAGTEAFNRKDYRQALLHWERLREVAPADSVFLKQVQAGMEEARALSGQGAAAAASSPARRP
jgi:cytochrome c-type biogenesis protein CcmH